MTFEDSRSAQLYGGGVMATTGVTITQVTIFINTIFINRTQPGALMSVARSLRCNAGPTVPPGTGIVRCGPRALPNRGHRECGLHISIGHRLRAAMAQSFDGFSCFRRIPAVLELVSASQSWGRLFVEF